MEGIRCDEGMQGDRDRWARQRAAGLLRTRESSEQASYIELFFDLIMVFALNRLVGFVVEGAGSADSSIRWIAVGKALLLFVPLIWTWTITAYMTARFQPETTRARQSVLLTAFAMLVMGTSLTTAFDGGAIAFVLAYIVAQTGRVAILVWFLGAHPLRDLYYRNVSWFAVGAVFWIVGALTHGTGRLAFWGVAVAVELGSARLGWPLPGRGRERAWVWALRPHYLTERYQQLMLIALGESILSVGATFAGGRRQVTLNEILGLLVAFLTAVLLWRIYFHRAGLVLGDAVSQARDPAGVGRFAGSAHFVMIIGILGTSIGHGIVQTRPIGHSYPAWLAMILGGPACFLLGRTALELAVFARTSLRRWVGIAVLLAAGPPLLSAPPLVAASTAAAVLFGVVLGDSRQAAGRPPEQPEPGDRETNWLGITRLTKVIRWPPSRTRS
ncbi:low temperature requirement protein A [Micromonospora sp. NPDC049048]|uniref:low temperature requirement protein A n=1 Tax=Micromonospora sp. NPDC049048 TaxID=3364263 RepID=UPI00371F3FDB